MIKLEVVDNWGKLDWSINDQDVTNRLKSITAIFPNGDKKKYKIVWKKNVSVVYDHGQQYSQEYYNAFINVKKHGLTILVDLLEVKDKIEICKYSLRKDG
jgi:hypothetical protein